MCPPVEGGSAERVLRGLPTVLRAMPIFALFAPRRPRLPFSFHPEEVLWIFSKPTQLIQPIQVIARAITITVIISR